MKILLALIGIGLCAYGVFCTLHMHAYIGTPHYFSNPWFWKASACIVGCFIVRIAMGMVKPKPGICYRDGSKNEEKQDHQGS